IIGGIKTIAKNELWLSGLLFLTVAVLLIKSAPVMQWDNLASGRPARFFLPYGVVLFALAGSAAIPEMRRLLQGRERELPLAIFWGTFIPIVLYAFFILVVVGVTGSATTEEAINGLAQVLGSWVVTVGAIFGVLAVFTSFLVLGLGLREIFHDDFKLKKKLSLGLALAVPLAAYLLGLKSFIVLIGFIGAVASGLDGILTVLIYLKAKKMGDRRPEFSLKRGAFWGWLIMLLFSLGIIYQFVFLSG
ncbi:MAG: aromatic amino acid transport family protein, partial [Patescibacteria group bacterium]